MLQVHTGQYVAAIHNKWYVTVALDGENKDICFDFILKKINNVFLFANKPTFWHSIMKFS